MYLTTKTVPVTLLYRGEQAVHHVGIATRDYEGRTELIFGLCHFGAPMYLSHMCYLVDQYFDAKKIAEDTTREWFYFDAGTTCAEIKIDRVELAKAFRELGMISDD